MNNKQSIQAMNAQLASAVSILDVAADELQNEWDAIPTVAGVNVPMRDLMRDLADSVATGNLTEYMANCTQWPRLG
jgi:hypothetical protein